MVAFKCLASRLGPVCFVLFTSSAFAQTAQEAFERFVETWQADAYQTRDVLAEEFQYRWKEFADFGVVDDYADTLVQIALSHLDSASTAIVRHPAVNTLSRFRRPAGEAALRRLVLQGDELEAEAAEALLRWGDWDLAAPVLERHRRYGVLAKDPRALPILYRGMATAGPTIRLNIAEILASHFNDDSYVLPAARDVLAQLPKEEPYAAARNNAIMVLQSYGNASDIALFSELVMTDSDLSVRWTAFGALVKMATEGNGSATSRLDEISRNCSYMDIRERASTVLRRINSPERR